MYIYMYSQVNVASEVNELEQAERTNARARPDLDLTYIYGSSNAIQPVDHIACSIG